MIAPDPQRSVHSGGPTDSPQTRRSILTKGPSHPLTRHISVRIDPILEIVRITHDLAHTIGVSGPAPKQQNRGDNHYGLPNNKTVATTTTVPGGQSRFVPENHFYNLRISGERRSFSSNSCHLELQQRKVTTTCFV